MKITQVLTTIKMMPKRMLALPLIALTVLIAAASSQAFGPANRPTYTIEQPASHVTFNSITNNPNYGDERNFVIAKDDANNNVGGWSDTVNVQPGHEYIVRMYVHNNAADNLNLVAKNTTAYASVPTTTGTSVQIQGIIGADNANPQKVWDEVVFKSDKKFNLAYVAGSAKFTNNVNSNPGFTLPDSIVTSTGAKLGYQQMDGNIPGCFKYSGIVTFKVKAQVEQPVDYTVKKDVRLNGTTEWKDSITANPGQKVDYRVAYTNTSAVPHYNVVVKDQLPAGVSYNAGTTTVKNASKPQGVTVSDNVVKPSGINIGNYDKNSNAGVYFTATLPSKDKLPVCGPNKLINTATVEVGSNSKSDTAEVIVNKECQPGKINVCDLATKKVITIDENQFDSSKHSKNLADCEMCPVPGKEHLPKNSPDCAVCPIPGKEHLPKDSPDCVAEELPQTGIGGIAGLTGLGALTAGAGYFIRSLRARRLILGE